MTSSTNRKASKTSSSLRVQARQLPGLVEMITTLKKRKDALLRLGKKHPREIYVYDQALAEENICTFEKAFTRPSLPWRMFFAIKSNSHLSLLQTVAKAGHGLDAASERELALALKAKPRSLVITGPGKDSLFFEKILHAPRSIDVTIHLESIDELRTLGAVAQALNRTVRVGVRVRTKYQSTWAKFGIALEEFRAFFDEAKRFPHLSLEGVQFHISWMSDPKPVVATLKAIHQYIKQNFTAAELQRFSFIDIGGGIVPPHSAEGLYPWNPRQQVDFGRIHSIIPKILNDEFQPRYLPSPAAELSKWGEAIERAFLKYVKPLMPKAVIFTEPGRAISHNVMHILLHVKDIKASNIIIVDGGNNMVGWEKHEFFDYTPVYNLTRFEPEHEWPCLVYGSLCTPHDLWGFYLRGPKIVKRDDIICLPFQGSYTNTLMQDFIRGMPHIIDLR